jgi:hypothetical protein
MGVWEYEHHIIHNCQLSTANLQLSNVNRQPSTVNRQLSTVNRQLPTYSERKLKTGFATAAFIV